MSLEQQVEHGFTHLPAGCTIMMERVARQSVLENIRQRSRQSRSMLSVRLHELAATLGRPPRLSEFLERTEIDPDDIYRRGVAWSRLLVEAGLRDPFHEPDEVTTHEGTETDCPHQRLGIDSPPYGPARTRIDAAIGDCAQPLDDRRLLMLEVGLWKKDGLRFLRLRD